MDAKIFSIIGVRELGQTVLDTYLTLRDQVKINQHILGHMDSYVPVEEPPAYLSWKYRNKPFRADRDLIYSRGKLVTGQGTI